MSERKLKKTKSDIANSDMEANIEIEGQRKENGGWYAPFPHHREIWKFG